jgi:hypothetical protein
MDAQEDFVVLQLGQRKLVKREDIRAAEAVNTHNVHGALNHVGNLLMERIPASLQEACRRGDRTLLARS